jgi:hypothetical protein
MPAPVVVTLDDLKKNAAGNGTIEASRKNWFERVTVTTDKTLYVADMSPSELKTNSATAGSCPQMFGFAMTTDSSMAAPSTAVCDATCATDKSKCVQPPAITNADEIFVESAFYVNFKYSSDCRCTDTTKGSVLVTPTNQVKSGTVLQGVLVYSAYPKSANFLYLAPLSSTGATPDFAFTM